MTFLHNLGLVCDILLSLGCWAFSVLRLSLVISRELLSLATLNTDEPQNIAKSPISFHVMHHTHRMRSMVVTTIMTMAMVMMMVKMRTMLTMQC